MAPNRWQAVIKTNDLDPVWWSIYVAGKWTTWSSCQVSVQGLRFEERERFINSFWMWFFSSTIDRFLYCVSPVLIDTSSAWTATFGEIGWKLCLFASPGLPKWVKLPIYPCSYNIVLNRPFYYNSCIWFFKTDNMNKKFSSERISCFT